MRLSARLRLRLNLMRPSESPLLSICVPTYNRALYLSECLDSILFQVNASVRLQSVVEIVISDNGSTDDTASVVERYSPMFPKVRTIRHGSNLGPDRNINGCIRAATGDYIWVFSDDDIMSHGVIECVVDLLEADPALGIVHLNSYGFRGPIVPLSVGKSGWEIRKFTNSSLFLKDVSYWITFLSANVFRRDAEIVDLKIEEFEGSLFGFLAFYLGVLIRRQRHARLCGTMFARREDNGSAAYGLYKTFTVDLNRLFSAGISHGLEASAVYAVNAEILTYFLPSFTMKMKSTAVQGRRLELGPLRPVIECCWRYPEMWLVTVPVRVIPVSLSRHYWRASSKICAIFRYLRAA